MGFRTVVMLNNDHAHNWEKDPKLGDKIATAMNFANSKTNSHMARIGDYGAVVQCVHADTQTLAVLDGYHSFNEITERSTRGETSDAIMLQLLKEAADKLGYRLTSKRHASK